MIDDSGENTPERSEEKKRDFSWRSPYQPAQPRHADGGIKAQTQRGAFGEKWWARRWIAILERAPNARELKRGKRYARQGQVLDIEVAKGEVEARVQGTRDDPYLVRIGLEPFTPNQWSRITARFQQRAKYAAWLMAGRMPEDIEGVFAVCDVSLLPEAREELTTGCTCPEEASPCRHVAAVSYLLAEEFDRDPFLLFRLRGMGREELLGRLNPSQCGSASFGSSLENEALPVAAEDFWCSFDPEEFELPGASVPNRAAELPKRLGHFPFWRSKIPFLRKLEIIYENAAGKGLRVAAGED